MSDSQEPTEAVYVARGCQAWGWRLLGMRWRWEAPRGHGRPNASGWAWSRRAAIRKARRALRQAAEPAWEYVTA